MIVPVERRKGEGHQDEPKDTELASLVPPAGKNNDTDADAVGDGDGDSTKYRDGMGKVITACAMYSFCSVSMVLANKSLASR
jgi:hypothetical protein